MVASSRIRLRGLDVNGRHDLLAETTGLDKNTLQALRPEHGLTVEQAVSNIAIAAGATRAELPEVVARLIKDKAVRQDHAERVLTELRSSKVADQDQS
jgi:hypothetical protein